MLFQCYRAFLWLRTWGVILTGTRFVLGPEAEPPPNGESMVQAVCLYGSGRYAEWPDTAFGNAAAAKRARLRMKVQLLKLARPTQERRTL